MDIDNLKAKVELTINSFSNEINNKRARKALCYHLNKVFKGYKLSEVWEDCTEGEYAEDYSGVKILSNDTHISFNDWYDGRK